MSRLFGQVVVGMDDDVSAVLAAVDAVNSAALSIERMRITYRLAERYLLRSARRAAKPARPGVSLIRKLRTEDRPPGVRSGEQEDRYRTVPRQFIDMGTCL